MEDSTRREPPSGVAAHHDLAEGWNVLWFWGAPIALLLFTSFAASPVFHLSYFQVGVLLVIGTLLIGALCLVNAFRSGRTHCWIDGALLTVLGGVGVLNVLGVLNIYWVIYLYVLTAILGASFVVEWVVGRYTHSGPVAVEA
ncbi:MAG: hypothetical protein ACREEC_05080 [Thermoplasmata archaeon]